MYADIIVDISAENLDKTYQYSIPERLMDKITAGTPVNIPFGKGNRTIAGYVVDLSDKPKIPPEKIKPIASVREKANSIDSKMVALAWWMKEQFGSTMNDALHTVIPVSRKVKENVARTIVPKESQEELRSRLGEAVRKKHVAKQRFLEELLTEGKLDYDLTTKKLNISAAVIKKFEDDGAIKIESVQVYRNPFSEVDRSGYVKPVLNDEQSRVAEGIISDIRDSICKEPFDHDIGQSCQETENKNSSEDNVSELDNVSESNTLDKKEKCLNYLIHGITGSGKTEIYMAVIDEVLSQGRQVIMLIPEISLTYQTVKRFYMRYGDRISIINSRLSGGERYDQYLRIKRGEADICIGPRSALFAPFEKLGLIIMDEEHEGSYISEKAPRYSTREVAFKRAQMEGASVILGSATPSLEAYTMAKSGRIKLFSVLNRANNAELPDVHVVDLRAEMKAKNRSIFSRELRTLIEDRLNKHEQIMLFLNRRGYSGMVSCRECGNVIKCPHCDISLTLHQYNDPRSQTGSGSTKSMTASYLDQKNPTMVCHYCGYTIPAVQACPTCGSKYIGSFGIGTQKVEEHIKKAFPTAKVLRLDADTTKNKNSYEEILSSFANEEADILVGTQMIVKGHDFGKCTLVGILVADMSLYSPDFRAGERTFQLLTQASGRAGRGKLKGDVVIQTYNPDHYCIETASRADYQGFYDEEIAYRKVMDYPPARCMLTVILESKNEQYVIDRSEDLAALIKNKLSGNREFRRIVGPADAPLYKANDLYRRVVTVKSGDYALLVQIKDLVQEWAEGNVPFKKDDEIRVDYVFN
ncbi:MAG: primosomal protein N' [Lachnospiraceae bacterium]|nr:primosomal protein N' [Lachnospiraceae bacterium]